MKIVTVLIVGLTIGLTQPSPAYADDGMLNALSLIPLPAKKVIQVQALDDSDDNLALLAEIEKRLLQNGYELVKKADIILSFETSDQIGGWNSASKGHVLSLEASGGRGGGENHKARVNVYDSSTGGLLNPNQGAQKATSTSSQYRLEVSVESRTNGKTLWRAWSVADLQSGEGLTLTKKMVPLLIDNLGKTVRSQAFSIE